MTRARFILALPCRSLAVPGRALRIEPEPRRLLTDGPRLWIGQDTPTVDLGEAGHAIGMLFRRDGAQRVKDGPEAVTSSGLEAASQLVAELWGAYLAILRMPGDELALMSDPSGLFPVYYSRSPTHFVATSDPRLFGRVTGKSSAIAWRALRRFLTHPELRTQETCLSGVEELVPGALHFPHENRTQQIWSPSAFLPCAPYPHLDDAAREVRKIAIEVMGAWADALGSVAVAASGGVDSSLICAALSEGAKDFSCATLSTADRSGDECAYVALLANSLGVNWIGRIYDPTGFDPISPASQGLPRPSRRSFVGSIDALLAGCAHELGADLVFDGNGGDNMFCFLHSAAPVVDRLYAEGPGRGVLETLVAMCQATEADLSTMVRASIRRLRRGAGGERPADTRLLLLADGSAHAGSDLMPSWRELDFGTQSGKRDHLELIMRTRNRIHGLGVGPRRFSPLMSQPILEFCLGMPTWLWFEGGINRAIVRTALSGVLPPELLARTSKAGPDSFIRRAFDYHRTVLRERLLDGLLERHGIIDRKEVEQALATDIASRDSIIYRLLDLAEAENWARSWT